MSRAWAFSPRKAVHKIKVRLGLEKDRRPPILGLMAAKVEAVRLGRVAGAFVAGEYSVELLDFMEILAARMWAEFSKGSMTKEAYISAAELLREVAEHPYKLMEQGDKAKAQLDEWDEQGLAKKVADADATLAEGTR